MAKARTPEGTARRAAKMREAAAKSHQPGRDHRFVSKFEQQRRMNIIEGLYLRGERNQEQVAARLAAGVTFEDGSTLKLSRSRTLAYFARLRERWAAEAEAERRKLKGECRRSLLVDLAGARANKDYGPVASLHKRLIEIDGLANPAKLDVTVRAGDAATAASMLAGWTAEQVRRFAETGEEPEDEGGPADGSSH